MMSKLQNYESFVDLQVDNIIKSTFYLSFELAESRDPFPEIYTEFFRVTLLLFHVY